jgi:hypothetical protein
VTACRDRLPPYGPTMAGNGASPPPCAPAHSPLRRAEQFVRLTARVLEQRLFAHRFLSGSADPVETAGDAYRNDDGGYGHALEPDPRGHRLAAPDPDDLGACPVAPGYAPREHRFPHDYARTPQSLARVVHRRRDAPPPSRPRRCAP